MKNLKKLREARGLSQEKLGNEFFLSQQSIYRYETKDSEPTLETLKKMADFFGTSVDYLIGHTDINRKIEELTEYHLSSEELKLIQTLKALNAKERQKVLRVIELILEK